MSNDLRNAVWERGPQDPTQRFILLSLCDRADEKGYCWPSHNDTAKRTGFTRRTVINAMSRLEADGWIATTTRYKRKGERSSNGVQIDIDRLLGSEFNSPPSETDSPPVVKQIHQGSELNSLGVVNVVHGGSELNSPESFIESSVESVIEGGGTTPESSPSPLQVLQEHFTQRKAIHPNDRTGTYERDWRQPLMAVLERAGGDVAGAAAMIDAALDVAAGNNEQGKTYTVSSPRSLSGIIANLPAEKQPGSITPETIWERALAHLNANTKPDEPRLLSAVRAVGWPALMAADEYSTPRLKSQLFNAYRSAHA